MYEVNANWCANWGICKRYTSFCLRKKEVHISCTIAKENVLDALNKSSPNSRRIGLDSLRAENATGAVTWGVSNRLFLKHG